MYSFKTKNIHWPTFLSSFSAVYRVSIPGGYPRQSILLFQASRHGQILHVAFVHDDDIECGTLDVLNHKHYDYASTALTLVNVTNITRLYGGAEEKEMLVFVYIFLVCGGDFSVSRKRKKIHVQVHLTIASQFYVRINVELYIHAFMCWKKRRSSIELSNNISDRSEA